MLHEKRKKQQQVMVVGKRKLEGAVVVVDETVQVKVEHKVVDLVLPPVGGEEQGLIGECGVGMCQRAAGAMIEYALGFQEHVSG